MNNKITELEKQIQNLNNQLLEQKAKEKIASYKNFENYSLEELKNAELDLREFSEDQLANELKNSYDLEIKRYKHETNEKISERQKTMESVQDFRIKIKELIIDKENEEFENFYNRLKAYLKDQFKNSYSDEIIEILKLRNPEIFNRSTKNSEIISILNEFINFINIESLNKSYSEIIKEEFPSMDLFEMKEQIIKSLNIYKVNHNEKNVNFNINIENDQIIITIK